MKWPGADEDSVEITEQMIEERECKTAETTDEPREEAARETLMQENK